LCECFEFSSAAAVGPCFDPTLSPQGLAPLPQAYGQMDKLPNEYAAEECAEYHPMLACHCVTLLDTSFAPIETGRSRSFAQGETVASRCDKVNRFCARSGSAPAVSAPSRLWAPGVVGGGVAGQKVIVARPPKLPSAICAIMREVKSPLAHIKYNEDARPNRR
jgi:hypothetical protein